MASSSTKPLFLLVEKDQTRLTDNPGEFYLNMVLEQPNWRDIIEIFNEVDARHRIPFDVFYELYYGPGLSVPGKCHKILGHPLHLDLPGDQEENPTGPNFQQTEPLDLSVPKADQKIKSEIKTEVGQASQLVTQPERPRFTLRSLKRRLQKLEDQERPLKKRVLIRNENKSD